MICLPKIKTAELSTYGNFAKCHQAHFCVSRVGLGTRLGSVCDFKLMYWICDEVWEKYSELRNLEFEL